MKKLEVFIGYDEVESISWHTMAASIFSQSSMPISITPINKKNFSGIHNRKYDSKQSNSFSYTRFLVPFLSDYNGVAVYFDCDMMLRTDIVELLDAVKEAPEKALHVVQHDYVPKNDKKYLGNIQYNYPRKNWSSVVVWNCSHPKNKILTPEYIDTAEPKTLHRFLWLDDAEIGSLDVRWNWLVGEYDNPPKDVKNVHWTVGGPYFNEYRNVDFSEEWRKYKNLVTYCKQIDE